MLLGWMQGLISMIWSALTSEHGNSFLQFIGNNWIKIVLILCGIGFIADLAVYVFRWQPYKVWRTFIRKHQKKKIADSEEPEENEEGFDVPEPAEIKPEKIRRSYFSTPVTDSGSERKETDIQDDLYPWRETETEPAEPDRPAETTRAGYTVPADSPYRRPIAGNRRRRIRISHLLGDPDEDGEIHYISPQPIVDQKEAYHAPVYPEKWTGSREQDS